MFEDFERSQALKGNSYNVNDKIIIKNPTLEHVMKFGEHNYYRSVKFWSAKPSEFIVELDDQNIDFTKITNYDLFLMFFQNEQIQPYLTWWFELPEKFSFKLCLNKENNLYILYDEENDISIDRHIYNMICKFIRFINLIDDDPLYNPKSDAVKKYLIEKLREDMEDDLKDKKNDDNDSMLDKYINAVTWNENSQINILNVWNITILQLYFGIKQISHLYEFKNYMAIYTSGNFDMQKNKKNINWF